MLRDALKSKGCLEEIETRLGKGGRLAKFFVPTFKALEALGDEVPRGRGGALHRHVQRLVGSEGVSKGYQAQIEKSLANGGSADVHLEKDGVTIAVEVSISSSTPNGSWSMSPSASMPVTTRSSVCCSRKHLCDPQREA